MATKSWTHSRAGNNVPPDDGTSPLRSREAALERLARIQGSLGRRPEVVKDLESFVRDFAALYRQRAFLLTDPRFARVQQHLKGLREALGAFTADELRTDLGFAAPSARASIPNSTSEGGLAPQAPCIRCGAAGTRVLRPLQLVACESCASAWLAEESLSAAAINRDLGLQAEERSPFREMGGLQTVVGRSDLAGAPPTEGLSRVSLETLLESIRPLYDFFVERTPLSDGTNYWAAHYVPWRFFRRILAKHDPRAAMSEILLYWLEMTDRIAAEPRFDPPPVPSELMLLALVHGVPGETYASDHYDRTLNAWEKALTRARERFRPSKKPPRGKAAPQKRRRDRLSVVPDHTTG